MLLGITLLPLHTKYFNLLEIVEEFDNKSGEKNAKNGDKDAKSGGKDAKSGDKDAKSGDKDDKSVPRKESSHPESKKENTANVDIKLKSELISVGMSTLDTDRSLL